MIRYQEFPSGLQRVALVCVVAVTIFPFGGVSLAETGEAASAAGGDLVDNVLERQVQENDFAAQVQKRIDKIADDVESMAAAYRSAEENREQLEVYNRQFDSLVAAQDAQMASLRQQIGDVSAVGREVLPHIEAMIAGLEKFVGLDVPFLPEERSERIERLREMMKRPDVTVAEKYRQVVDAYQVESEYGRTIEAYRSPLGEGDQERIVEFLRIGRVALLYRTLDGTEVGAWDQAGREWRIVDGYERAVRDGLRIARKQRAPDLIRIPLPAPVVVR